MSEISSKVDEDFERFYERVLSVGEECISESELHNLLEKKPTINFYDGFEPSGRLHIAQGLLKSTNVNKCVSDYREGHTANFIFWVADWFALMNDKMGGDLDNIKVVGRYLIEVWKAAGMDMSKVRFLWSSDEITNQAERYWGQTLDIGRNFKLARVMKCGQIMGRNDETLSCAQIMYPLMQCSDVFFLKADICQLGVDQRKVNMLAREYCVPAKIKLKPVILSHHMLYGLKKGKAKMSKSDPDSAIFMTDSSSEVKRKIMAAYCPLIPEDTGLKAEEKFNLVQDDLMNPCLDYIRHIVLGGEGSNFEVNGRVYDNYQQVEKDFLSSRIPENDLKEALAEKIDYMLEPVRQHFQTDGGAAKLLEQVKELQRKKVAGEFDNIVSISTKCQNVSIDTRGKNLCAIIAPLAHLNLSLATILGLAHQITTATVEMKQHCVLMIPDWSSYSTNNFEGDRKAITAFYSVLLGILKALCPGAMKEENCTVLYQSTSMLQDPNAYWFSVINVGRKLPLKRVMREVFGEDMTENELCTGYIMACLMFVGDILGVKPKHIVVQEGSLMHKLSVLTCKYFEDQNITDITKPTVNIVSAIDLVLKAPENIFPGDLDYEIFALDNSADVNKKIKRAFCEPGNTNFNPILNLSRELLKFQHEALGKTDCVFTVERKESEALSYATLADFDSNAIADFASEKLHPGDLKPCLSKMLDLVVFIEIQKVIKADKKSVMCLKNALKKHLQKK